MTALLSLIYDSSHGRSDDENWFLEPICGTLACFTTVAPDRSDDEYYFLRTNT